VLVAFLVLIGCQLVGEVVRGALHLPVPGSVIGMLLLAAALALRDRGNEPADTPASSPLDRTAGMLLQHMGVLFVPAGVGIIAEASLLRQQWLPIMIGVIGSTVLSLVITGLVMHRLAHAAEQRAEQRANAGTPFGHRTRATQ
jgi:holin-like protein